MKTRALVRGQQPFVRGHQPFVRGQQTNVRRQRTNVQDNRRKSVAPRLLSAAPRPLSAAPRPLSALLDAGLPAGLVLGGMIVGAFGTVLGGGVLVWRERRRNELTGHCWLRFWRSRLGAWAAKLAGIGLGARPGALELEPGEVEPVAAEPGAARQPDGGSRGGAGDS